MSSENNEVNITQVIQAEQIETTENIPVAELVTKPESYEDLSSDIPDGDSGVLPVKNPLSDFVFAEIPEIFYEEFDKANWKNYTFEEWNESITEEKRRIYYPSIFTMICPEIKFDPIKEDSKPKKDNSGEMAAFRFIKMHELKNNNKAISLTVTTPAFTTDGGFRDHDTGNGTVKSIKSSFDYNNPHHRHFWIEIVQQILNKTADEMLRDPSKFKIKCDPYLTPEDRLKKKYQSDFEKTLESITDVFRFPKVGEKQDDRTSTSRMFYVNPLIYTDPKTGEINETKVYLPGSKTPVSLNVLENICKGYMFVDGKIVRGKPKGFEFSAQLLFSRLTFTSKSAMQIKATAIYIHRFYKSTTGSNKDERHLNTLQDRIQADSERFLGLEGFVAPVSENNRNKRGKESPNGESLELEVITGNKDDYLPQDEADKIKSAFAENNESEDTMTKSESSTKVRTSTSRFSTRRQQQKDD